MIMELYRKEARYAMYIQYISNVGGRISTDRFDDDREPIGPRVRADMVKDGFAKEEDGHISLLQE